LRASAQNTGDGDEDRNNRNEIPVGWKASGTGGVDGMSLDLNAGLERLEELASQDRHLAVLITQAADLAPQVSVVNAGIVDHPADGAPAVALVARGRTAKLRNLRDRPDATLVFRAGWEWAAVRGPVELAGPDDPHPWSDVETQRQLLRSIYHAAGGHHDDLDAYDREMLDERRTAVLIRPARIWSNPAGTEHRESEEGGQR
jgi:PPOX class probable F420-dependent enzyme